MEGPYCKPSKYLNEEEIGRAMFEAEYYIHMSK